MVQNCKILSAFRGPFFASSPPPSSLGQVKFAFPRGGPKTSSPFRANIYLTPLPTADPTPIYGNGCHQEAGKGFFLAGKKRSLLHALKRVCRLQQQHRERGSKLGGGVGPTEGPLFHPVLPEGQKKY